MEKAPVIANWLTQSPRPSARPLTILMAALVAALGLLSLDDSGSVASTLQATPAQVFGGAWWRAFTTLFAHGDLGHLSSNLLLFIPLTYLILAYFGPLFYASAFLAGAAVNLAVLNTMPAGTALIGISGVVYWLGAAWLTLFLLIDRRERLKRRFGYALFLSLMLFVPETLKPEVSHLSHFLGAVSGSLMALALYAARRRTFASAERREELYAIEGEGYSDGWREKYVWELDREWETKTAQAPEKCAACG